MSLQKRIDDDLIQALKGRDSLKATTLRGLKSDFKYKKIDKGAELTDDDLIAVLSTAAKRHRESIEQFAAGNRGDLVQKETAELNIITSYLPEQMTEEKLRQIIAEVIKETGADSPAKTGAVMKEVMPKVKGQADGKLVSKIVAELLAVKKD